MTFTEMIQVCSVCMRFCFLTLVRQATYFNNIDMVKKAGSTQVDFHESDRPLILQVAATVDEADEVIKMVNHPMFRGHIDGVDLNCGCPQGFAMKRGVGAGLFRKPDEYVELVRKIVAGIGYPLSVKCRLHEDGVEATVALLRRVVAAGVVAVTLHGRTWMQKGQNRGNTDYAAMRAVFEALPREVAVVANGDIQEFGDFGRVLELTGARAGMSGYGALLNPGAVFSPPEMRPTLQQTIQDYLDLAQQHRNKLVDCQRHLAWLTKRAVPDKNIKAALFEAKTLEEAVAVLRDRAAVAVSIAPCAQSRITGPPKVEDIEDPKKRMRAEKKQRQKANKVAAKKRAREEKAAQKQEDEEELKKAKE